MKSQIKTVLQLMLLLMSLTLSSINAQTPALDKFRKEHPVGTVTKLGTTNQVLDSLNIRIQNLEFQNNLLRLLNHNMERHLSFYNVVDTADKNIALHSYVGATLNQDTWDNKGDTITQSTQSFWYVNLTPKALLVMADTNFIHLPIVRWQHEEFGEVGYWLSADKKEHYITVQLTEQRIVIFFEDRRWVLHILG